MRDRRWKIKDIQEYEFCRKPGKVKGRHFYTSHVTTKLGKALSYFVMEAKAATSFPIYNFMKIKLDCKFCKVVRGRRLTFGIGLMNRLNCNVPEGRCCEFALLATLGALLPTSNLRISPFKSCPRENS